MEATQHDLLAASGDRVAPAEHGASLVEYALLVSLIAVVCFAAVTFFGTESRETFSTTAISVAVD